MNRLPPTSTLFPYTTLFRSLTTPAWRKSSYNSASGNACVEVAAWRKSSYSSSSGEDRKSTRLNSSHVEISYAVFCLKKKKHYLYHKTYQVNQKQNQSGNYKL